MNKKIAKILKILLGLIVIASILTGAAFGIIALVKALTPPCKPGFKMDNDLGVCVQDGCVNVCGTDTGPFKKGNCLPDDYCNYSGTEGQYKFDPDTCECTLTCNVSGQEARTKDGQNSTAMKKDGSPEEPLQCGYHCDFSPSKLCLYDNDTCAISINSQGKIVNKIPTDKDYNSCYTLNKSKSDYLMQCPTDKNIVCSSTNEECVSSTIEVNIPHNGKYTAGAYCKSTRKCGDKKNPHKRIFCNLGSTECSPHGNCIQFSNGESGSEIFNNKGIYNIGYCSNYNKYDDDDSRCQEPKYVGQDQDGKFQLLKQDDINSGFEGISLKQPQCIDKIKCKSSNLVSHWFCKPDNIDYCQHGPPQNVVSCGETPPLSSVSEAEGGSPEYTPNCCNKNSLATLGSGSFCCPLSPIKSGSDYLCLNRSKYPYESLPEITCNNDNDCRTHSAREELMKILTYSNNEGSTFEAQYSNPKKDTYSDLFCDNKNKKCNFFAGYVDKVTKNNPKFDSLWLISDDPKTSRSEAIGTKRKLKFEAPQYSYNEGQNLQLCRRNGSTLGKFGIYDSNGNPGGSSYKYYSVAKGIPTNKEHKTTNAECLLYAKNRLTNAYFHDTIDSDNACIFKADCASPEFATDTIKDGRLKWNFGPNNLKKGGEIIINNGSKPIKFAAKPKSISSGQNCASLSSKTSCNTLDIPQGWSARENYFQNVCKWVPLSPSRYGCRENPELPKYALNNTDDGSMYCSHGYTVWNKKFQCKTTLKK